MIRPRAFSLVLLLLLLSPAALAGNAVARDLLIPIAGRNEGAFGSFWQTDIVVSNTAESGEPVHVGLTLLGETNGFSDVTLRPGQTAVLRDAILGTFHRQTGRGLVRVAATAEGARITAHARIYNINGSAGEFGQIVPAVPVLELAAHTVIAGLSGVSGNRTNAGLSNPNDRDAAVTFALFDRDGVTRASGTATVRAMSVLQINDLFTHLGVAPFESAALRVKSTVPIYSYASVVRSDSGDADFITVASADRVVSDIVTPACASPAKLTLTLNPAPGYIFVLHRNTDLNATIDALEAKYDFTLRHRLEIIHGFAADMSPETLAAIRCEPSIDYVAQNGIGFGGAAGSQPAVVGPVD